MHTPHALVSGLSGHELYCLHQLSYAPGQLTLGNSVVAMGALSSVLSGLSTLGGGEVKQLTELVHDGRKRAIDRMVAEAKAAGGQGLTSVSFEMANYATNLEFVAQGSAIHRTDTSLEPAAPATFFATAANGQELFCQQDAGFAPKAFVFGNIAYSIGVGGVLRGAFTRLARGEVKAYTEIFDKTRHAALARIVSEARAAGANSVLGIQTNICALLGTQEMTMVGTAAHHPALERYADAPVTSDLTSEEMWNVCHLGMAPVQLVMGVTVYSLGISRRVGSFFRSFVRGEVDTLTELLSEARDTSLARVNHAAAEAGADAVLGVKLRVYELGSGLVEVMALGTAVKKIPGMQTRSKQLFPQALVADRSTFFDTTAGRSTNLNRTGIASANRVQGGPLKFILLVFGFMITFLRVVTSQHK
jgi:uncharacterized protein YbjQ (UPF0145 family)